jgi:uncharacterized damage-inducible protein DinB
MHVPLTRIPVPPSTSQLLVALSALLTELRDVLAALSPEQYTQKPVGPVTSSIGGHTRHALDHIECILTCNDLDGLDYDHRARGTPVEANRNAALRKIDDLIGILNAPGNVACRPIELRAMVTANGQTVSIQSTTDRELLFTFSHTLHHNALIRVMIELLGGRVPERFGYAPATLTFLDRQACAR